MSYIEIYPTAGGFMYCILFGHSDAKTIDGFLIVSRADCSIMSEYYYEKNWSFSACYNACKICIDSEDQHFIEYADGLK